MASNDQQQLEDFIKSGDLHALGDKGVMFEKNAQFKTFLTCTGCLANLASVGLLTAIVPVTACCQGSNYDKFDLVLTRDSVVFSAAQNDCCFHIATTQKTVPLEKIQDVQLDTNCCLSCWGLKSVNVETAGQSGAQGPEVQAAFLMHPEAAREAIQLAVKKWRDMAVAGRGGAPAPQVMGAALGGGLKGRLANLEALVSKGVLTQQAATDMRVAVLAAEQDPTARLMEAQGLFEQGAITREELLQLARLVAKQHA